jgi:hypothetical protein
MSSYIEHDILLNHEQKQKLKKTEYLRLYKIVWAKQTSFLESYPLVLGQL